MLQALADGEEDAAQLAQLAKGTLRTKVAQLQPAAAGFGPAGALGPGVLVGGVIEDQLSDDTQAAMRLALVVRPWKSPMPSPLWS
jgi:hypothetical protein